MLWFGPALFIPIVACAVLWFWFKRSITWQEFILALVVPAVFSTVGFIAVEKLQTRDTEYWGGYVTKAEYYEDWDEEVPCTHAIYETETDSEGNTHEVFVGYEHAYDVDDHPPYWQALDSNGEVFSIGEEKFNYLCLKFANKTFVDMHRVYHSNDGDKYETVWNPKADLWQNVGSIEPTTSEHAWENRVKASSSIFKRREVDPKTYGLYEYPEISGYSQKAVLGNAGDTQNAGEKLLQYYNAVLGAQYKVRMFVLLFKNKPLQAGIDQQDYWGNGNKNELVACIGVDNDYNVQWSHVFSWTDVELLKIEIRNFVMEQKKLELDKVAEFMVQDVRSKWKKKDFREFSYLTVEPPFWAVVLVYLGTLGVSFVFGLWAVNNAWVPGEGVRRSTYSYVGPRFPAFRRSSSSSDDFSS